MHSASVTFLLGYVEWKNIEQPRLRCYPKHCPIQRTAPKSFPGGTDKSVPYEQQFACLQNQTGEGKREYAFRGAQNAHA